MKITQKVSFHKTASEASYIYLNFYDSYENSKNETFWRKILDEKNTTFKNFVSTKIGAVFLFAAESEAQFDYLALPSELMCEV